MMGWFVQDNPEMSRYELTIDEQLAAISQYRLNGDVVDFIHTETRPAFEHHGAATTLVREALADVRRRGLMVQPDCPFVRAYIAQHPEEMSLVPVDIRGDYFPGSA